MSIKSFRCRADGKNVLIDLDGKVIEVPWEVALDISSALRSAGKEAEEYASADKIILDHAILTRIGSHLGLSNNPKILEDVRKETLWNKMLRKYIKQQRGKAVFGTPTIMKVN